MVWGTGVDLIEIQRIQAAAQRNSRFLNRVFTPEELEYCLAKQNPWPHLAARFAVKEAGIKVFAGRASLPLREIGLVKDGPIPLVRLSGSAAQAAQELGISDFKVSIAHSRELAIAMVIGISQG